ncbi:MAG: DUF1491 family protein [Pseudomonadota bacterium]
MRLKSEIWVKAYLRQCAGQGIAAVVVRHGDDDAGAIYLKINRLDGTARLFGPAAAGLSNPDGERRWTECLGAEGVPEAEVDARLRREIDFDSDLWVIEVEARDGRHLLDDWLAPRES